MTWIGKAITALGLVLLIGCSAGEDEFTSAGNEYVERFHQDMQQGRYTAIYQASSQGLKANASEQEFVDLLTVVNRGLGAVQETRLVSQSSVKADTGLSLILLLYTTRFAEGEGTESFYLENADGKPLLYRYDVNSETLMKKMIEQGARTSQ